MSDNNLYRVTINDTSARCEDYISEDHCVANAAWAATRENAEALVACSIKAFRQNYVVDDDDNPCITTADDYTIEEYQWEWLDDDDAEQVRSVIDLST